MAPRPPFPPFDEETALQKVQAAEDAWNTRDPERVALAYTEDSVWRNRDRFVTGRDEITAFLRSRAAHFGSALRCRTRRPSPCTVTTAQMPGRWR
jgi:uncharacterized protein (TIGR02246 family)